MTVTEQSAEITCSACAMTSTAVHITSFTPFVVNPADLLTRTFNSIGITDDVRLTTFRKAAASLSPVTTRPDVLAQDIDPTKAISLFADFLEAKLAQALMAGGAGR